MGWTKCSGCIGIHVSRVLPFGMHKNESIVDDYFSSTLYARWSVGLESSNMPVLTTPKRILALHCFREGSRGVPRMCKAAQTLRQKCGDAISK